MEQQTVRLSKRIAWRLQYWAALALIAVVRCLPIDAASGLCGWLMRCVGPRLRAHKIARKNLSRTFPQFSPAEVEQTLRGMWDNLGRIVGEMPHASAICDPAAGRVRIVNPELLYAMRDDGKPGLLFSGHFGNWELPPVLFEEHHDFLLHPFYRAPNNPLMHDLFNQTRSATAKGRHALPKGREGAKKAVDLLKAGEHLAVLIDQKMNDGIEVPFFGRPAMTAPALASLGLKYDAVIAPCHVLRTKGAYFEVIVEPPLPLPNTGNRNQDILELMTAANEVIERWVTERPDQWLWAHRRWKD